MEPFLTNPVANSMQYIGALLASLAALSFLVFLRGMIPGTVNVFNFNFHHEHLEHAHVRIVWGVLLIAFIFGLWEVLRFFASLLGYDDGHSTSIGFWVLCLSIAYWVVTAIWSSLFGKKSGGGGH
jgi:hypothetical protein